MRHGCNLPCSCVKISMISKHRINCPYMKENKILRHLPKIIFISFFIGLSFFLFLSSPEEMISLLGVQNSFIIIFILSFLGGLTTFTGVPYYPILAVFAAGSLHPVLLGLTAASGVAIGDSTSYFVGYHGSVIIPKKAKRFLKRLLSFFMRYPRLLPFFFFFYGAFVPLSNDFIVVTMGMAKYPFWRVMIPLGLGNVVFNVGLALIARFSYGLF
jgi:membrane protein DedA with SNARE-associated domain